MRKSFVIIVMAVIATFMLCLAGCGSGGSQSGTEVKDFDAPYYRGLLDENPAKATTEFEGNTYKVEGLHIIEIDKDNVRVSNGKIGAEFAGIYTVELPTEEIAELEMNQSIVFVGTIEKVPNVGETRFTNAYLVE